MKFLLSTFIWLNLLWVLLLSTTIAKPPSVTAKVIFKNTIFVVEVVEDPIQQSKGLGGQKKLEDTQGMLFVYKEHGRHRFWMKDMLIPIDIIWLDNGRVVHIAHQVPPPKPGTPLEKLPVYQPQKVANLVLEVAAGRAMDLGLKKGDYLKVHF